MTWCTLADLSLNLSSRGNALEEERTCAQLSVGFKLHITQPGFPCPYSVCESLLTPMGFCVCI